nr:hypothetical protein [Tanacetum cinerariifolium]
MVAIDGVGFDWSYMAEDEVSTNMALMAFLDSKSLDKLIRSQITDKSRKGVGFDSYNDVPPPPTGLFLPPKIDLSYSGLKEFKQPEFKSYGPKFCETESNNASKSISNELKESPDTPLVKNRASNNKDCSVKSHVELEKKTIVPTAAKIEFVKAKQHEKPVRKPFKPKPFNTARPNPALVNDVRVNQVNVVKASACWVWRPTKPNGASITLKRHNYIDILRNSMEDMLPLEEEQMVAELLVKELFTL